MYTSQAILSKSKNVDRLLASWVIIGGRTDQCAPVRQSLTYLKHFFGRVNLYNFTTHLHLNIDVSVVNFGHTFSYFFLMETRLFNL